MESLDAISPIDGRYREQTKMLAPIFSEAGLMRARVVVEGEYFIALSEHPRVGLRKFSTAEKAAVRKLYNLSSADAKIISDIERTGYKNIKATQHDVKAVEYFMKEKLARTSLKNSLEWLHFALTSEDTNNLAYALMLSEAINQVILPALHEVLKTIEALGKKHSAAPMLARTHGQPASPTTFGKECAVFAARLRRQVSQLENFRVLAKLNGATGNYNAHIAAYPKIDWPAFTRAFITHLNKERGARLEANMLTTQIESHDTYAELFDILRRANVILIDFDRDMWRYISDGWVVQKPKEGEVGSSTMPHKVNPIRFENSEGNLGVANALLEHFSLKLPISRLQRDLSDSTVLRNIGTAFGHCVIGYSYLLKGLGQVSVNEKRLREELHAHPEVVAEAIQTVLRREGAEMPYEKLKALTRGKAELSLADIHEFIDSLSVPPKLKKELRAFTPENYTGIAQKLADLKK